MNKIYSRINWNFYLVMSRIPLTLVMRGSNEEVHSLYIRTVQAENDEYKKILESNNTEATEE